MLKVLCRISVSTLLMLALAVSADADEPANAKQIDELLAEVKQLRNLLERHLSTQGTQAQQPPQTFKMDVSSAPYLGAKDAPLAIVEFLDYQCHFCQQFNQQAFQDLKKLYIDSGKVRFYVVNLPSDTHPNALLAAESGRCAVEQGLFWAMHDRLQLDPSRLELENLVNHAREVGADAVTFRQCVESGKHRKAIQQEAYEFTSKGVRGTPTFVIGKNASGSVEGELVLGAVPFGIFEKKLSEIK